MTQPCSGRSEAALGAARKFLDAIVWGEHLTIWDMLTPSAREVALAGAARRGLDAIAAERARQGTWTDAQRDELLGALVRGLRVDLAGAPLDELSVGSATLAEGQRATVVVEGASALPTIVTGGRDWPVARIVLVEDATGGWSVERIDR